jgi:hypothetical protein
MAYTNPKTGQEYTDQEIAAILSANPKWSTMTPDERRATGTYGMIQPGTGSIINESSARTGNVPVPSDVLLGSHTQNGSSWSPQDSVDNGYMTPEQLAQWREDRGSNLYGPSTPGKLYTGDFEPPEGVTGPGKPNFPNPTPGPVITPPNMPPIGQPPPTGPQPPMPPPTGPQPQGKGGGQGWNPQGAGSYDAFKNPMRPMANRQMGPMPPMQGMNPGVFGQQGDQYPPSGGGKGGGLPMQPFQSQPPMGYMQSPMPKPPSDQKMLMQALTGMMQPKGTGDGN